MKTATIDNSHQHSEQEMMEMESPHPETIEELTAVIQGFVGGKHIL